MCKIYEHKDKEKNEILLKIKQEESQLKSYISHEIGLFGYHALAEVLKVMEKQNKSIRFLIMREEDSSDAYKMRGF